MDAGQLCAWKRAVLDENGEVCDMLGIAWEVKSYLDRVLEQWISIQCGCEEGSSLPTTIISSGSDKKDDRTASSEATQNLQLSTSGSNSTTSEGVTNSLSDGSVRKSDDTQQQSPPTVANQSKTMQGVEGLLVLSNGSLSSYYSLSTSLTSSYNPSQKQHTKEDGSATMPHVLGSHDRCDDSTRK